MSTDAFSPLQGGAFLEKPPTGTFFKELFTADELFMAESVQQFMQKEVMPCAAAMEAGENGQMPGLLLKAGELGLTGAALPERYGGLNLPKTTQTLLTQCTAVCPAFAVACAVHSGVGALPLLLFGSDEQKMRFLPELAAGRKIAAFALTEADSGSDARAAHTTAVLLDEGGYRLEGSKAWITNGGFAHLFTVFAQLNGQFSAFLVESDAPGFARGREEQKLGLHGCSTRRILLEGALAPADSLLGEPGQGHLPAFCALNPGRLAIGAIALGMGRRALALAVEYAKQRKQFGRAIAQFGLVQRMLAQSAAQLWLAECALYRAAGEMDAALLSGAPMHLALADCAIECAAAKLICTETAQQAIDACLQIHGGYGYSEEYAPAQLYRDIRVFRIFEGTSEVVRLSLAEAWLKRLREGRLKEPQKGDQTADRLKQAAFAALQAGFEGFGRVQEKQQQAADLSDIAIAVYALEAAEMRSRQTIRNRTLAETAFQLALQQQTMHCNVLLQRLPGGQRVEMQNDLNAYELNSTLAQLVLENEGGVF